MGTIHLKLLIGISMGRSWEKLEFHGDIKGLIHHILGYQWENHGDIMAI